MRVKPLATQNPAFRASFYNNDARFQDEITATGMLSILFTRRVKPVRLFAILYVLLRKNTYSGLERRGL